MMTEAMRYMASAWATHTIRISAQQYLTPFYATLGFECISPVYDEAGIPHVKMLKN